MCPEQQSTDGQSWVCDAWVVAHAGPRDAIAKTYKGETTGLPDANIGAVALNVTAVGGIDDKGYGFVTVYPLVDRLTCPRDVSPHETAQCCFRLTL